MLLSVPFSNARLNTYSAIDFSPLFIAAMVATGILSRAFSKSTKTYAHFLSVPFSSGQWLLL